MTTSEWQVVDEPSDSGFEVEISAEGRRRLRVEQDGSQFDSADRVMWAGVIVVLAFDALVLKRIWGV